MFKKQKYFYIETSGDQNSTIGLQEKIKKNVIKYSKAPPLSYWSWRTTEEVSLKFNVNYLVQYFYYYFIFTRTTKILWKMRIILWVHFSMLGGEKVGNRFQLKLQKEQKTLNKVNKFGKTLNEFYFWDIWKSKFVSVFNGSSLYRHYLKLDLFGSIIWLFFCTGV